MKCSICEDKVSKQDAYYGDPFTAYEKKPLCEICYYESEPNATIFYRNEEQPFIISDTRNETEGDFQVSWISTDPWRGYYVAKSSKYSMVNTSELLAYHESQNMLEDFDTKIRELYDDSDVEYARVFARSSNVFFQNYDLFVKKEQVLLGGLLVAKVKDDVEYDNPRWYRNIIFDEESLDLLNQLFPEKELKVDADALKLVRDYGDEVFEKISRVVTSNS